jgi:predicted dehydrogenase
MKRIPIAIVGLNFGRHILEEIVNGPGADHVQLAAVCDIDPAKAQACAEKYGVEGFTDLDQLLKQKDIPAIGLFTGPGGRADLLNKILDAGKDVMTTKPFEIDCQAGLEVLRRAKKLGRIIHLNSPAPCWSPDLATIQEWRDTYQLGRAVGCNLSVWVRYHEQADGSWYDDQAKCPAAPIFRLGIYLINDLVRLFGEAEKVAVFASRLFTGRPTADNAQLMVLFKNGVIANIYASFCIEDGDHYRNSMTLNFERGTIYRNTGPIRNTTTSSQAEIALVMGSTNVKRHIAAEKTLTASSGGYQWDHFAAAVQGQHIPEVTTPEIVIGGLRILEAMREAELQGTVVTVKPVMPTTE